MREPRLLSLPLLEDAQATATFLSKRRATTNDLRVGELGFDTTDGTILIFHLLLLLLLLRPSNQSIRSRLVANHIVESRNTVEKMKAAVGRN